MKITAKTRLRYLVSPLEILPGKSGDWEIRRTLVPAGTKQTAVSMRTSMFTGEKMLSVVNDHDIWCHELLENGQRIMSDIPQEAYDLAEPTHYIVTRKPRRVLIAGLGLGYIIHQIYRHRRAPVEITVVEKEADVINLVGPSLPVNTGDFRIEVVHADFHDYVREAPLPFGYVILDTWTAQSEGEYWHTVVPLRRQLIWKRILPKNIWAWKEDEMRGQASFGLRQSIVKRGTSYIWWPHQVFFDGLPNWVLKKLPEVPEIDKLSTEEFSIIQAQSANANYELLNGFIHAYLGGLNWSRGSAAFWETHWGKHFDAHQEEFK